jgi:hypothetical protein
MLIHSIFGLFQPANGGLTPPSAVLGGSFRAPVQIITGEQTKGNAAITRSAVDTSPCDQLFSSGRCRAYLEADMFANCGFNWHGGHYGLGYFRWQQYRSTTDEMRTAVRRMGSEANYWPLRASVDHSLAHVLCAPSRSR